ncbi:uncharacterized protein M6B38_228835 [Iris pallida]|uniref:C2H2-type domain-containing protein n=1 Tax=Iris pallida TaxID=29817 RepID=A0AAX6DTC1_IRIPA|nr:uncharacterized protein M6B38_228835 [Iris pallida]
MERLMTPLPSILFPPKPSPLPPTSSLHFPRTRRHLPPLPCTAPSASAAPVEMSLGPNGVYLPHLPKVVILWDLDNKPPRGPPFDAALSLRRLAEPFGRVVDFSAYANRHAFLHLPSWVLHQRRQQRHADIAERRGLSLPASPYLCSVCGRKCRTNLDLKKHFRQLHERERNKKLSRMRSLKGKKRQKFKERHISGNTKYEEAARELLKPKTGYGLAPELRRAGVFVKTVEDRPQAADSALKRQMQHSMARGIDWMFLVSDDSDFTEMVRRAREADLRTVVVGDGRNSLGQSADLWASWGRVESGEVGEEVFVAGRDDAGGYSEEEGLFSVASFYEGDNVDDDYELEAAADEIVVRSSSTFRGVRVSAFSEEEVLGEEDLEDEFLWDSEDEEDGYI